MVGPEGRYGRRLEECFDELEEMLRHILFLVEVDRAAGTALINLRKQYLASPGLHIESYTRRPQRGHRLHGRHIGILFQIPRLDNQL